MMLLSGDQNGLREFAKGLDMHRENGALFFDVKPKKVTKDQRYDSKTSGFSLNYQGGVRVMIEKTGCSYEEAKRREHLYFNVKYKRIRPWWAAEAHKAKKLGYAENVFGRKRNVGLGYKFYKFVTDNVRGMGAGSSQNWIRMLKAHIDRQVSNFPIQSFAADLINTRIIILHAYLKGIKNTWIVLQVHDEVDMDIPAKKEKKISKKAVEIMEWKRVKSPNKNVRKKKYKHVDLLVDTASGSHWQH
jgi:DNA polymerase-1